MQEYREAEIAVGPTNDHKKRRREKYGRGEKIGNYSYKMAASGLYRKILDLIHPVLL